MVSNEGEKGRLADLKVCKSVRSYSVEFRTAGRLWTFAANGDRGMGASVFSSTYALPCLSPMNGCLGRDARMYSTIQNIFTDRHQKPAGMMSMGFNLRSHESLEQVTGIVAREEHASRSRTSFFLDSKLAQHYDGCYSTRSTFAFINIPRLCSSMVTW